MEIISFHFTEVDEQHEKFSSSKVFGKDCCSMLQYSLADDGCSLWRSLVKHLKKKIWCREKDDAKQVFEIFIRIDYFVESTLAMRKMMLFSSAQNSAPFSSLRPSRRRYAGAVICCFSFKLKALLLGRRRQPAKWKRKDDIFLFGFPVAAAMERKSQHLLNFLSSLSLWRFEFFIFFNPLCSAHYSSVVLDVANLIDERSTHFQQFFPSRP